MSRKPEDIRRDYEAFGLPMTRSRKVADVDSRVRLNDPRLPKVAGGHPHVKASSRKAKAAAVRALVGMPKVNAFPSKATTGAA